MIFFWPIQIFNCPANIFTGHTSKKWLILLDMTNNTKLRKHFYYEMVAYIAM